MAWMENDLLRMMQINYEIFGNEILQIKDATDEWIIKYFKNALLGLLDYRAKLESELFNVESSRFGGIENITPKNIELTKEQCAEIGNHLLTGIVMLGLNDKRPKINKWDSKIILNYIENGDCFTNTYKLMKTDSVQDSAADSLDESCVDFDKESTPDSDLTVLREEISRLKKELRERQINAMSSTGALEQDKNGYFSPEEVRAMSPEEVRRNYQNILNSMKKWN